MADVAMGFLFVQAADWKWDHVVATLATLAMLIAASSLLYIAGVVLNDVFDLEIDRRERPERPMPSGRVSLDAARRLGWRLLVLGVALGTGAVFFTGQLRPGVVAALLATVILLYDAWLKRTPLGPLAMGACRMLNVLLGMSAVDVRPARRALARGRRHRRLRGRRHLVRPEGSRRKQPRAIVRRHAGDGARHRHAGLASAIGPTG